MKRPALPLMLLILASIFLLFLLNLLLGSVHIPFGKIWELLWGDRSGFQSRYDEQPGSYLEQYPLEKPCAAGLDGIGGGSGAFGQRFADADGVP